MRNKAQAFYTAAQLTDTQLPLWVNLSKEIQNMFAAAYQEAWKSSGVSPTLYGRFPDNYKNDNAR